DWSDRSGGARRQLPGNPRLVLLGRSAGEDLLAAAGCSTGVRPEPVSRHPEHTIWFGESHRRPRQGYNRLGMPLPQQPVRRGRRLTLAVASSVIGHLLLL